MGLGTVISSIIAMVVALALVLAMAWGAIWLIKKVQDRQLGVRDDLAATRTMHFVRSMPLGQRERIVLVEVGDREMLLGVTAGGINLLADWPVADRIDAGLRDSSSENAAGNSPLAKSARKFPTINFPARPGKS